MPSVPFVPEISLTEKLCQSGCTRAGVDTPLIGRLQRFVTDFEQQTGMEIYQPGTKTLGKVAILAQLPIAGRVDH